MIDMENRRRLARLVEKATAGASAQTLARETRRAGKGIAPDTWAKVLAGEPIERPDAIERIEEYLGWEKGDIRRVLTDRKFTPERRPSPIPLLQDEAIAKLAEIVALQGEIVARYEQAVERAERLAAGGAPDPEHREAR